MSPSTDRPEDTVEYTVEVCPAWAGRQYFNKITVAIITLLTTLDITITTITI